MSNTAEKMLKVVENLKKHFQGLRTNRANPEMLHGIMVEYYGSMTPLHALASISVPENMVLALTVFDKGAIKSIEKAIQVADLGMNPQIDGNIIRLRLPELTGERRQQLVKQIEKISEENKVMIRNIRRASLELIKKQEKEKEITEDESKKEQAALQKLTDDYIHQIDHLCSEKEKEILTV
jgi:ribosome recycling factor